VPESALHAVQTASIPGQAVGVQKRKHRLSRIQLLAAVQRSVKEDLVRTVQRVEQAAALYREDPSQLAPILQEHANRGEWMPYFSVALLVVAIALAVLHIVERRSDKRRLTTQAVVAILALAVGISSMIQIYRVGDAGSQSVWGGEIAKLEKENGT
jgi:hypothetical protein